MGIFSRISDIANANILHMLEKAEDPEKMVRLMITEMEDTLVEVKSQAAKIISDKKQIERNRENLGKEQQSWQEKAELAVEKGRDDLARGALQEKAKRQETLQVLSQDQEHLEASLQQFRSDILALEAKLNDAKNRQKQILLRRDALRGQQKINRTIEQMNSYHAFIKFEKFERDLDRLEGENEAMRISHSQQNLTDELDALKRETVIEDEINRIKQKRKMLSPSSSEVNQ